MNHNSLQIINTFSKKDVLQFSLFLKSPYFNHNNSITKLYCIICNEISKGNDSSTLTLGKLCNLYGTQSQSTIKNLLAKMFPLLEKFLAHNRFEENEETYYIQMINEMEKRKLMKFAKRNANKLEKKLNNNSEFYISSLNTRHNLNESRFNIDIFNKPVKDNKILLHQLEYYNNAPVYIFYYLLHNLLPSYIMVQNICRLTDKDPDKQKLDKFYKYVFSENKIPEIINKVFPIDDNFVKSLMNLDWLYLQIGLNKNLIENSIRFIKILKRIAKHLNIDEKYNYYSVYHSWFPEILKHPDFQKHEFDLYDDLLKNKGYMSEGHDYMSIRSFIFLYTRGDNTGRYSWTDTLMAKYIHAVHPDYRDSLVFLRNAYLHFRRDKNYDLALAELAKVKHLNEVKIKRDFYHLGILLHYELNHFDMVLNLLENFYKFLNKESAPGIEKKLFAVFLSNMKKLVQFNTVKNNSELELFKRKIIDDGVFPSQPWFIEKVGELMKLQ